MNVSEFDMLAATQIAYADLDVAYEKLSKNGTKTVTVIEAIEYTLEHDKGYKDSGSLGALWDNAEHYLNITETADGRIEVSFKGDYKHLNDWNLRGAVNDNNDSGFCACIIDVGDTNILACRGSEAMNDLLHIKQDWVEADIMLLNSEQTKQEGKLREYMQREDVRRILGEGDCVSTGHSLGGALADHAAVVSVEDNIGNYCGTINFDGPGHSEEYIAAHAKALAEVASDMEHKKASVVGNLLSDLPGVHQTWIETSIYSRFIGEKSFGTNFGNALLNTVFGCVTMHGTEYWVLDKNGNTVPRSQNAVEWVAEYFSKFMDRLPPKLTNWIPEAILSVANGIFWIKQQLDDHEFIAKTLFVSGTAFLLTNFSLVASTAIVAIVGIVTVIAVIAIGEYILEAIEQFQKEIAQAISEVVEWLSDKVAEIYEAITEVVNDIRQWFREKFNKGVDYARNNPYVKVDTAKLREYANRLSRVNSRLRSLDSGMRSLYWQVGLLDLWDILCSNAITSESWSLDRAKSYLNNTANRFEKAENKANGYVGG